MQKEDHMKTQGEDGHMQAKDRPQKKSTLPILWFQISNLQTMFGLELLLFSGSPASNFPWRFWTCQPPQSYKPIILHTHTHTLPVDSVSLRNLDLHREPFFFFFLTRPDVKKTNTVLIIFLWWLFWCYGASLITQLVKNPPAMQETLVQFLGQEDPLEKG